jgi:hypothetical protein
MLGGGGRHGDQEESVKVDQPTTQTKSQEVTVNLGTRGEEDKNKQEKRADCRNERRVAEVNVTASRRRLSGDNERQTREKEGIGGQIAN